MLIGMGMAHAEAVIVIDAAGRIGCAVGLPQVLAARGADQAVDGVVGVVGMGFDHLVIEKDGLLGVVPDVGDVAGRIVGIVQILQAAGHVWARLIRRRITRWRRFVTAVVGKPLVSTGIQVNQPEGLRIVTVAGLDPVAVLDQFTLAFFVIVDVGHHLLVGSFGSSRRSVDLTPQPQATPSSRLASL